MKGKIIRSRLIDAFESISSHEYDLYEKLDHGLTSTPRVDRDRASNQIHFGHTPTISFTLEGFTPIEVCQYLASKGICAWDGHFYAQRAIEVMGLLPEGGVTRLGLSIYTSEEEVALYPGNDQADSCKSKFY